MIEHKVHTHSFPHQHSQQDKEERKRFGLKADGKLKGERKGKGNQEKQRQD
jgi:hypothetical protein